MEIRLYKGFVKRADSTKQPTGNYISKQVRLKENTSVNAPTFLLSEYDDAYNYVYVPRWNRYYFRNDATLNIQGVFELSLTFDHLATYKPQIGAYNCFVERCSDSRYYRTDVKDSVVSPTEDFERITSATTELWGNGGVYVCRVLNKEYGITTYIGSQSSFKGLFDPNVGPITSGQTFDDAVETLIEYYLCNPKDYVLDMYFLNIPLRVLEATGNLSSGEHIQSGWYTATTAAKRWTSNSMVIEDTITPLVKPAREYDDFRKDDERFTTYNIYIPSVGCMPLSGDLLDDQLRLKYVADIQTGDVTFMLYAWRGTSDPVYIASYHGNVKSGSQSGSMTPSMGSMLASGASLATSVATGNPVAIGVNVFNAVDSVISRTPSIAGAVGSNTSIVAENRIVISEFARGSCEIPVSVVGRPCNKNLTLGNLSGFIKCSGASINNISGTLNDKTLVNNSLNGGFYYE